MCIGQSSVSNTEQTSFNLILPTTVVDTFSLFDASLFLVQFVNTVFPIPLLLAVFIPPDGQVVKSV